VWITYAYALMNERSHRRTVLKLMTKRLMMRHDLRWSMRRWWKGRGGGYMRSRRLHEHREINTGEGHRIKRRCALKRVQWDQKCKCS